MERGEQHGAVLAQVWLFFRSRFGGSRTGGGFGRLGGGLGVSGAECSDDQAEKHEADAI